MTRLEQLSLWQLDLKIIYRVQMFCDVYTLALGILAEISTLSKKKKNGKKENM